MKIELVGQQKRIYEAVKRAYPERISTNDLVDLIYSERSDGGPIWANSTIRRLIFDINQKIAAYGERLSGKPGRSSSGYVFVKHETEWDIMWAKPFQWPQYL